MTHLTLPQPQLAHALRQIDERGGAVVLVPVEPPITAANGCEEQPGVKVGADASDNVWWFTYDGVPTHYRKVPHQPGESLTLPCPHCLKRKWWKCGCGGSGTAAEVTVTDIRAVQMVEITPKGAIAAGFMPSKGSGLGTPERFRHAAELVGGPYPRGILFSVWQEWYPNHPWESSWAWRLEVKR